MRVYLSEPLFECEDRVSVLHLLLEARFGRHHLLLRPAFARDHDDRPIARWLRTFDDDMRERLMKLLEASAELASRRSSTSPSITVIAGDESNWQRGELSVPDASSFLRLPLKLYLENKTLRLAIPAGNGQRCAAQGAAARCDRRLAGHGGRRTW